MIMASPNSTITLAYQISLTRMLSALERLQTLRRWGPTSISKKKRERQDYMGLTPEPPPPVAAHQNVSPVIRQVVPASCQQPRLSHWKNGICLTGAGDDGD